MSQLNKKLNHLITLEFAFIIEIIQEYASTKLKQVQQITDIFKQGGGV